MSTAIQMYIDEYNQFASAGKRCEVKIAESFGFFRNGVVVDLFCGAGGLTQGFRLEGFPVSAGIDVDEICRHAYEHNNDAPFIKYDVAELNSELLADLYPPGTRRILVGCAPCQPFSTYNYKNDDPKWELVGKFSDLIVSLRPDYVSMENVPRLLDFQNKRVFTNFVKKLECAGYAVWYDVVFAPDYGVPQRRSRLVLLASLRGEVPLIPATHERSGYETVEQAIGSLPPLAAGGVCEDDPLHRSSRLSDTNIERIRASRPGGSWADWRPELRADCHKAATGKGYRGVYGRMRADEPAPTITTQFFGFGNGRFGHPTQERALSLREGAILQSFPPDYSFAPPGESIQFKKLGRLIGNAVPVALGRAIARSISIHMMEDRP